MAAAVCADDALALNSTAEEAMGAAGSAAASRPASEGAASAEVSAAIISARIAVIIRGRDFEQLNVGSVRAEVERCLKLEPGALLSRKEEVSALISEEVQRCQTTPEKPGKPHHKRGLAHKRHREQGTEGVKRSRGEDEGGRAHGPATEDQANFLSNSQPLSVVVGGDGFGAAAKVFSSGAQGWYSSRRVKIEVEGEMREAMCQVNVVLLPQRLCGGEEDELTPEKVGAAKKRTSANEDDASTDL